MTAVVRDEVLTGVVAAGLPGSLLQVPREELSEQEAGALAAIARHHRIAGMVLASVQADELRLPRPAMDAILDLHGPEVAGSWRLESELVWVAALLDRDGIETRVLGDVALGHLDYREPALRAVGSIALLVRPGDIYRAVQLLGRNGWQPRADLLGGATLSGPSGLGLELHTTVDPLPPGVSVDGPALWSDRRDLRIGTWKLSALGDEQRLLHASFHAVVHGPGPERLVRQRDVAEAVLYGAWDRSRLLPLAASWNAEDVLARAVRAAWQRLEIADVTRLSVWAGAQDTSLRGQPLDDVAARPRPSAIEHRTWRRKFLPRFS